MLKNPFKVGEQYANRRGTYEVIDSGEKQMTIRYEDGEVMKTPIRLQKRIVDNMQIEAQIAKQRERAQQKKRRRASAKYGRQFDGLVENDFKDSVRGTSWRARTELGGLLARKLTELSGRPFKSRAVPRRPQVYVLHARTYDRKSSHNKAKFRFALNEERADYGLYLEKSWDQMDESWDWLRLLAALREQDTLREVLTHTMEQHDLRWLIRTKNHDDELEMAARVMIQDGQLVLEKDNNEPKQIDWDGFVELLESIPAEKWCNLYLMRSLPKEKAMALEDQIADEVAGVWNGLLPLYTACIPH